MKTILSLSSWPLAFISGLLGAHFAFSSERPMFAFALIYPGEVLLLFLLERYIPYERRWLLPEGETANDIAHTALTKGLVQIMALLAVVFRCSRQPCCSRSPAHGLMLGRQRYPCRSR